MWWKIALIMIIMHVVLAVVHFRELNIGATFGMLSAACAWVVVMLKAR